MKTTSLIISFLIVSFIAGAQDSIDLNQELSAITLQHSKAEIGTVYTLYQDIESKTETGYRMLLSDAKESDRFYTIGIETYTEKELVKLFKKAARKSVDGTSFRNELDKFHPLVTIDLEDKQVESLYETFSSDGLHAYISDLEENYADKGNFPTLLGYN